MTDVPPQLGLYPVLRELGRGGMGVVYLARDPRLDRLVALKILSPDLTHDAGRLARFEREARILASMRHPNIAGIYSLEEDGGQKFLVLEYVEGDTLGERLARGLPPPEEAMDCCRQIAAALEAAHESGVVHRDLKPANVKITPAGEVRVLDFGLAKEVGLGAASADSSGAPDATRATTQLGLVIGTAAYMSPEQARGRELDRRTDIWSFGCVLFECLAGRQAFAGGTISDTLVAVLERDPDLDALPRTLPARVRELIARCLAKDPRRRLRDIGEARITLEEVLAARSASGRWLASDVPALSASRPAHGVGTPVLAGGALLLAILAVLAGAGAATLLAPRGDHALRNVAIAMPPGIEARGSILTPDGRMVTAAGVTAHGGQGARANRLYARDIGATEFHEVAGSQGFENSYLSPDGGSIYLAIPAAPGVSERRLVRASLDGASPPTPVCEWKSDWHSMIALADGSLLITDGVSRFTRVSADGEVLAPMRDMVVNGVSGVSRVELTPRELRHGRGVLVNVISYGARGWLYSAGVLDPATGKVGVLVIDGGNAQQLDANTLVFARGRVIYAVGFESARRATHGTPVAVWNGLRTTWDASPGYFRLTDAGDLYYAPGGNATGRTMATLGAGGRLTPTSPVRRAFNGAPELAPDGHRFVCSIVNPRGVDELWLGDMQQDGLRKLTDEPEADCSSPAWSPDGARLAYKRQGATERDGVYVLDVAGGGTRRVLRATPGGTVYRPSVWLANGTLLLTQTDPGNQHLVVLPTLARESDSSAVVPFHRETSGEGFARESADGRWIAYTGTGGGAPEAYVVSATGPAAFASPVRVTTGGARQCRWAPDAPTLYFTDAANRLLRISFARGLGAGVARPDTVADLDAAQVSAWTILPGGRVLCTLLSDDEASLTHYALIEHWGDEVHRRMRVAGAASMASR